MKRALLLVVLICSVSLLGCYSKPTDLSEQVKNSKNKTQFPKALPESQSTPEFLSSHFESAHERANYFRGLSSDAKFDPKKHVEMLKKYENDPDSDVAAAAKELLAKAQ